MGNIDRYFLATNSLEGFISHFSDSYSAENGFETYIIKGGPGTGKSSLMKNIAQKAMEKGYSVSLCHCSSDPDSLDGVIIKDKKTVVLDGTSPHTVEPKYPGACENIIDLGRFWDSRVLREKRMEIINATNINKTFHKTASLYLSVCGEIAKDNLKIATSYTKRDKVLKLAEDIALKNIPKTTKSDSANETIRFLSGITPNGIMSFPKTITESINNIVVLEDKIGAFSTIVCEYIRRFALDNGYDIITIKNAFLPNLITDHIIIPSLSFAVCTENKYFELSGEKKRIHSRRFSDFSEKKKHKNKILFGEKVENNLLFTATEMLSKAKKSHDILESYYINAMDFEKMENYTNDILEEIFN